MIFVMLSRWKPLVTRFVRSGWIAPLGAVLVGWLSLHPSVAWLKSLSFDLPFLVKPAGVPDEAVIVYLDESSYQTLDQPVDGQWDRRLHARS